MSADWILILETSVTNATLVLARNGQIFAQAAFTSERSQECDLYVPLQELLAQLPKGEKLSAIVIGTGPGSYNGARVGIATAQAIAQVHRCRVAGLCSFESVPEILENENAWAIGDARRGAYFFIPFMNGISQSAPRLLEEAAFLEALKDSPEVKVTFESPDRLPEAINCTQTRSTAEGLLKAWLRYSEEEKEALLYRPAEAFYLRPPHITKSKKKDLF